MNRPGLLAVLGCALAFGLQANPSGHHVLRGHIPSPVPRLKASGAMAETNVLRLSLGLPLRKTNELSGLLRDLYDSSSGRFHRFLKPSEFAEQFGPTEEDYQAVSSFARSHGLKVVHTSANRLLMDVEGTVADIQKTFHVHLNVYQHPTEKRTFFAPDMEPTIDDGVPLQHVGGLDNYLLPKPKLVKKGKSDPSKAGTGSGPGGTYMGRDFRFAYTPNVALDGAGQIVALVEFDDFYNSDIVDYENEASLAPVPISRVEVDNFTGPPSGSDGEAEVSLDIELAISMAPGLSQVLVYQAPYGTTAADDDLLNQIALDNLAGQIACCWDYSIDSTSDSIFQEMAAQGQSFFDASGDSGAYYVDMPPLDGDPYITLVGGTTLTTSGPLGNWVSETVWNWFSTGNKLGAAGSGGTSVNYSMPYWQASVNWSSNQGSATWRNVPDVAMVGDNIVVITTQNTDEGLAQGETLFVGGTSCATPLWAAFTAMINQQAAQNSRPPVGFLNPAIYGLGQSALYSALFHDINTGNNTNSNGSTKYFATTGFDLCTGWGTPAGQALINALAAPDSLVLGPSGGAIFDATNGVALGAATQPIILENTQNTTADIEFGPMPSWLQVSTKSGFLLRNIAAELTLQVTGAVTNMAPGSYTVDLLVTNLTSGVTHIYPVFLKISDPLIIAANSGMSVAGPVGGPFSGSPQVFSLSNAAPLSINWTAQSTSTFAGLSPSSGTLPPGAVTNVTGMVSAMASNLLINTESGNLVFTDLSTTNTQTLPFTLTVGNGGFETGDFSDWTFAGNSEVNFVAESLPYLDYIHSGEYAALLGEPNGTASLTQSLPTTAGQLYQISFYLDNPVGGPVNQFGVIWGGTTLFNQTNVQQTDWINLQLTASATGAETTLEFIFRNDPDAFGLDDISVTPLAAPAFSSVSASNGAVAFSWNATPGWVYQLQYASNLTSPAWTNCGGLITASNSVVTTADLQHTDPQRFYRIELVTP